MNFLWLDSGSEHLACYRPDAFGFSLQPLNLNVCQHGFNILIKSLYVLFLFQTMKRLTIPLRVSLSILSLTPLSLSVSWIIVFMYFILKKFNWSLFSNWLQVFWLFLQMMKSLLTNLLTFLTPTSCPLCLMMVLWTLRFWSIFCYSMITKMDRWRSMLAHSYVILMLLDINFQLFTMRKKLANHMLHCLNAGSTSVHILLYYLHVIIYTKICPKSKDEKVVCQHCQKP